MNGPARIICFPACAAAVLLLTGCLKDHYTNKAEEERRAKLAELRSQISASFFVGALGYVVVGLLGPTVSESGRKLVADRFRLSQKSQIALANWIYLSLITAVLLFSIFSIHLKAVLPAVILLAGATAYPFFGHVIPSLRSGDVLRRKAAMAQIKSFLMLIFIFYVILRLLSPEGFGEIKLA